VPSPRELEVFSSKIILNSGEYQLSFTALFLSHPDLESKTRDVIPPDLYRRDEIAPI
jgi:hypothetical protein